MHYAGSAGSESIWLHHQRLERKSICVETDCRGCAGEIDFTHLSRKCVFDLLAGGKEPNVLRADRQKAGLIQRRLVFK